MDRDDVEGELYRFRSATRVIVSGPSGCGKTYSLCRMLNQLEKHFVKVPTRLLWFYAHYEPKQFDQLKTERGVEFIQGFQMSRMNELNSEEENLAVIDDQMDSMSSETLSALFTRVARHQNCHCFYLAQNLYNKSMRIARINCNLLQVFKSPQDKLQIQVQTTR
jgi:ABC-type phosphate transport system ATPase subunit